MIIRPRREDYLVIGKYTGKVIVGVGMLMAIPLQLLYELSVLIAWYWYRQDQKRQALAEAS